MGYYLQKKQPAVDLYRKLSLRPSANKKYSKYRGVGKSQNPNKPWKASFTFQGIKTFLGHFVTEREAAEAYNRMAKGVLGDAAILNVFDEDEGKLS